MHNLSVYGNYIDCTEKLGGTKLHKFIGKKLLLLVNVKSYPHHYSSYLSGLTFFYTKPKARAINPHLPQSHKRAFDCSNIT